MADPEYWEKRRRYIEQGAKMGGVAGMRKAEREWNETHNPKAKKRKTP